ncbi:MAG: GNAT family N-acetyltransferase, partial [bacterium]
GEFEISTDPKRLDVNALYGFRTQSYWAKGRPREVIEKSLKHSLNFGLYKGSRQIGFARVVTDYATFAWLCDVHIENEFRRQGLGKWLTEAILGHPDLQNLKRWLLVTRDAHGLYTRYGFKPLEEPARWMQFRAGGK